MLIRIACLLLIVPVTVPTEAQVPNRTESFTSGGKPIQVEVFSPAAAGRHPAVLLLYGAGGLTRRGDAFRRYGSQLAEHGLVTFLVHYFDATGSDQAGRVNQGPLPLVVEDGVRRSRFRTTSSRRGQKSHRHSRVFPRRVRSTGRGFTRQAREGGRGVLRWYVGRFPKKRHAYAPNPDLAW